MELAAIAWQDVVLAFGSLVGLVSKAYALADEDTVWSRWVLYIASVAAFATLGLWLTAATATCSMLLWFGIGIWRAPSQEQ